MVHLSLSSEALLDQMVVVSTIITMKFTNSNKICILYLKHLHLMQVSKKVQNGVFVQLYPVWRNHNISKGVKMRIFSTKCEVSIIICL